MPRALPLCSTCGAWSEPCGHPPDPRVQWVAEPLRNGLLDLLGMAVFSVLFAATVIGVGPLLWWLAYGWPPSGWLETLGVIMIALISLPGAVIGVGMLVSIPEHYRGRRWNVRDLAARDDDRVDGFLVVRRRGPDRGDLTRTRRSGLPAPVSFDMTTETAARTTADPGRLFAVALAGLLARGHLELARVHEHGWSRAPDEAPRRTDRVLYYVRPRGPRSSAHPWLERTLLDLAARAPATDLLQQLERLAYAVAGAIGFEHEGDDPEPHWPAEATRTPGEALQARLLEDLGDEDGAPPDVDAALAAWRAQHPDIAGLLERIDQVAHSVLESPEDS